MSRSTDAPLRGTLAVIAALGGLLAVAVAPAPAQAPPDHISMEDGIDPRVLGPDSCTAAMNLLGQCTYTHLDPAYAPPLAIDEIPPTTSASSPADPGASCGGQTPPGPSGKAWACTFSDEFSGSTLGSTWTQALTAKGTQGFANGPTAACFDGSADNVAVSGGELRLTVTKSDAMFMCDAGSKDFGTRFRGGGIFSKRDPANGRPGFDETFGRFDIRAAFPQTTQRGLQSALWMWPEDPTHYGLYPASGEIDIAEYYTGRAGFVVPTLHYNADASQKSGPRGINTTQNTFCHFDTPGAFHTYTLIWEPTVIAIYYDGTLCLFDHWKPTGITAPAPFDQPFFVALTAALGVADTSNAYAEGVTELPATTRVDWVRAWHQSAAPARTAARHSRHAKPRRALRLHHGRRSSGVG